MHTKIMNLLRDGYTAQKVATLTKSTPARVRDATRVLGYTPHANGAGVFPVYDLLEEIERHLRAGRPRQWVARALDISEEAVNSADRLMLTGGKSLRSWSLRTYDWVEWALAQEGASIANTARLTRTSYMSIKRWFPEGKPLGESWGSHKEPHEWGDVAELARQGMTVQEIADKLEMPPPVVRVALFEIGYAKGALEEK